MNIYDEPLMLCVQNESREVDLIGIREGIEYITESIHRICYREFMSRPLISMWEWEQRTKSMFEDNHLHHVGEVVKLPMHKVNRLIGCGYQTRNEVYNIFCMYHLRLKYWSPESYRDKLNYKF